MGFFSMIEARCQKIDSLLCVGLDPHPADLAERTPQALRAFCLQLIAVTAESAAAFKPNSAFFEAFGAQPAAVAAAAWAAIGRRRITAVRQGVVHAEFAAEPDDGRFGEVLQGRPDANLAPGRSGPRPQPSQVLEGGDVLRAAVGITRVIERVDADHEALGVERLRPREGEREKHGVACGHVCGRNIAGIERPVTWDGTIPDERRSADRSQVHGELYVTGHAQRSRDAAGGGNLLRMRLAGADRQRGERPAVAAREGRGGGRIEPA